MQNISFTIKVNYNNMITEYPVDLQSPCSLLEVLRNHGVFLESPCAGKKLCGQCRIRVREGHLAVTTTDQIFFTKEELDQGFRLACTAFPESSITIEPFLLHSVEDLSGFHYSVPDYKLSEKKYSLCIDLGTTTIWFTLYDHVSNVQVSSYVTMNSQRAFGADVISRIQSANEGNGPLLKKAVLSTLKEGIQRTLHKANANLGNLLDIFIAANTTMTHLLLGYSCSTLGIYPFKPVNIKAVTISYPALFNESTPQIPVKIMPGLSTFVGGDIISGLFHCHFDKLTSPSLFIDLGTNGELALGQEDTILCSSVAAGPAFEGGNISCGTGSLPGAIYSIQIKNGRVQYHTIDNKMPIGICGTGAIDLLYELLLNNLMDSQGLLLNEYRESGFPIAKAADGHPIIFTQKDIREMQLAISAVYSGIEALRLNARLSYDDIETVFLAGSFGYHIDIPKAIRIGLFPEKYKDKIKAIGNSSLRGLIDLQAGSELNECLNPIISKASEITLAEDENFQSLFVNHMNFPSQNETQN